MDDLKQISKCVQSSLEDYIKRVHLAFDLLLRVYKVPHGTNYFRILLMTSPAQTYRSTSEGYSKKVEEVCTQEVRIALSNLVFYISEDAIVSCGSIRDLLDTIIPTPTTLKKIPITFINSSESKLIFGDTTYTEDPTKLMIKISTQVGLGISYKLKEKIQSHCRQKCDKFMRCILRPEECNLAYVMEALGSKT